MSSNCYICRCKIPKTKSIFRIPDRRDEYCERGNLWLKILEAPEELVDRIRICSEHFLNSEDVNPCMKTKSFKNQIF